MTAKAGFLGALALGVLIGVISTASSTPTQSPTAGGVRSIRNLDFEALLTERFRKEHKGFTMEKICGETGKEGVNVLDTVFGDVDGDGEDEAAVMAFSCLAGTSGPDLIAVYKLEMDGKVIELPIAGPSWEEMMKGLDPKVVSLRLGQIRIEKQTYYQTYSIWGGDKNQNREFAYRWDGHRLALVGMKDITIK